ncbi:hypothetical protein ACWFRB_09475 [Rhodococcus sp. NPDC055112]
MRLVAENYKRLTAVEITPDPAAATVTIAGRNAQGKSSVIDAIWAALAGSAAAKGTTTTRPIRDGEESARVTVDLGDIVVTRTWSGEKTALKVESVEGARYGSPQKMLDELIGRLSFDPLAFASLSAKAQQAELLQLVELPFNPADLAARRASVFEDRTDLGRTVKQLQGQLDGYLAFPVDTPDELVSVSELMAELDAATAMQLAAERAAGAVRTAQDAVDYAEQEVERARQLLENNRGNLAIALGQQSKVGDLPDVEAIRLKIDSAESTNATVRQRQERDRVAAQLADTKAEYDALTAKIAELDGVRSAGLAAAEFPVPGLGFDDEGVTYGGVPFAQASAAERLRVSVAMAMALNPRIRVIRITDGSLLDSENLALIEEMATAGGFQVWIERVDESGTVGVVIEDGSVKA